MPSTLPSNLEKLFVDYGLHLFKGVAFFNYALFEKEIWTYFDQWYSDPDRINDLFNRFAGFWVSLYRLHQFSRANQFWDLPIDTAHRWEAQSSSKLVHKGTPYYFKGMSLIKVGNIDRGFLFFHQAVEEDQRSYGTTRQTPAWLFVTLDMSSRNQAALDLVQGASDWLGLHLTAYHSGRGGVLSLANLRSKVLGQVRLDETSFSFTHTVFRAKDLLSLPSPFRSSQFASQIELDILFNLARIAEVWLKDRQRGCGNTFAPQLKAFFQNRGWSLSQPEITALNATSFDNALTDLLDGARGSSVRIYSPVESDLLILYMLRNEAGHAPTASVVIQSRFSELVERSFFALFTIAEKSFP
jgi:hypothetical protein